MIVKPYERAQRHNDPRQRAGGAAERQMAHYLDRALSGDESVFVLHGLRLEDHDQPEHNGSPGVCQIDHLVVHRRCASLTNTQIDGAYGMWAMETAEAKKVAEFLAERHTNRTGARITEPAVYPPASGPTDTGPADTGPKATELSSSLSTPREVRGKTASDRKSTQAACRHCGSNNLEARSGRYGYYWNCYSCDKNTSMPQVCSACGAKRPRARVRKERERYFRDCDECETSEAIWTGR